MEGILVMLEKTKFVRRKQCVHPVQEKVYYFDHQQRNKNYLLQILTLVTEQKNAGNFTNSCYQNISGIRVLIGGSIGPKNNSKLGVYFLFKKSRWFALWLELEFLDLCMKCCLSFLHNFVKFIFVHMYI